MALDFTENCQDLLGTKKIKHPAEFTQVDAKIDVRVLDIDQDNRKISLGHKQLEENPWDIYEEKFIEGEDYEGEVMEMYDKGALVKLEKELEAFAPKRHLS